MPRMAMQSSIEYQIYSHSAFATIFFRTKMSQLKYNINLNKQQTMLKNLSHKVLPLLTQSQAFLPILALKNPVLHLQTFPSLNTPSMRYSFSSYFNELDQGDVKSYSERKYQNKKYRGLIALWKKPLEQKRKRQERIKQIKEALPVPPVEGEKLVVHNSAVGIAYPPGKNEIFCVIKANGFQYKVTQDCLLIVDTTEEHEINKTIKFDEVLLAGTATYTVLGRPVVNNTYVEGVVESISESEKTIVFKKKRRKQYKKSFGSRVKLTSLRITRIVHELTSETLSRAVGLTETQTEATSREATEGK